MVHDRQRCVRPLLLVGDQAKRAHPLAQRRLRLDDRTAGLPDRPCRRAGLRHVRGTEGDRGWAAPQGRWSRDPLWPACAGGRRVPNPRARQGQLPRGSALAGGTHEPDEPRSPASANLCAGSVICTPFGGGVFSTVPSLDQGVLEKSWLWKSLTARCRRRLSNRAKFSIRPHYVLYHALWKTLAIRIESRNTPGRIISAPGKEYWVIEMVSARTTIRA